jgi:hypothetical protein
MQTFLPYPSFERSVKTLDWRRLGKQRVEAFQILKALNDPDYGWQNHPAVKMWRGYERALTHYMNLCIEEWISRGYNNTMEIKPVDWYYDPPFIGKRKFHDSHKSNLLRKDADWYGQFGWSVGPDLEYVWMTGEKDA